MVFFVATSSVHPLLCWLFSGWAPLAFHTKDKHKRQQHHCWGNSFKFLQRCHRLDQAAVCIRYFCLFWFYFKCPSWPLTHILHILGNESLRLDDRSTSYCHLKGLALLFSILVELVLDHFDSFLSLNSRY